MAIYTGTSSNSTKNEKQYRRHFVVCYYFKGCYVFYQSQVTNARIMNDSEHYINTEGVGNKGQHWRTQQESAMGFAFFQVVFVTTKRM